MIWALTWFGCTRRPGGTVKSGSAKRARATPASKDSGCGNGNDQDSKATNGSTYVVHPAAVRCAMMVLHQAFRARRVRTKRHRR